MEQYRTTDQLMSIIDSMDNGNFRQAAKQAVDGGWYAADFIDEIEALDLGPVDRTDFVLLVEMATELRYKD